VNYRKPNPRIRFENTPFFVNSEAQAWSERRKPRIAAVNSLGVGGTNAFMVVEAYRPRSSARKAATPPFVVPLSARDDASLRAYATRLAGLLGTWDAGKTPADLQDLAYTLQVGRVAMARRIAFVVASTQEQKTALAHYAVGGPLAPPASDTRHLASS